MLSHHYFTLISQSAPHFSHHLFVSLFLSADEHVVLNLAQRKQISKHL